MEVKKKKRYPQNKKTKADYLQPILSKDKQIQFLSLESFQSGRGQEQCQQGIPIPEDGKELEREGKCHRIRGNAKVDLGKACWMTYKDAKMK